MRKAFYILIGLILVTAQKAYAFDNHDFQIWNTDVEEFKINASSRMALEEEFRLGGNAGDFYYQHYDLGFIHDLNKYLNIGAGYRQIYEKKNSSFKQENEPYVSATVFYDLNGFKLDSRSRLEYRHFDYQSDSWRYRNKFNVKFPWKFTSMQIQPYVADEIFIKLNGIVLNTNRLYAGLGFNLTKNLKGEVYYLLQDTENTDTHKWTDINVLGTKLKISF